MELQDAVREVLENATRLDTGYLVPFHAIEALAAAAGLPEPQGSMFDAEE